MLLLCLKLISKFSFNISLQKILFAYSSIYHLHYITISYSNYTFSFFIIIPPSNRSHYYSYASDLLNREKTILRYYEYCKLECIEMVIWPLLYLREEWCESNISGQVYTVTSLSAVVLQYSFYLLSEDENLNCIFSSS